ncbi:tyrosine-type recombinase/integrase [Burkholderia pseudomallei]|uniref:tyrosine-type recombinase/integrase n=1 Tax=Burkholderia pseudomallei TaxID=28450 RepID=UPI001604DD46|nr:hypothetical protein [Burkholderia pseudomallei]
MLKVQHALTGRCDYIFPSAFSPAVPLADATLNHLFKRLGFGVPEFSPHGTRGTAATLLAHKETNQTRGSYLHDTLVPLRRKALQLLADEIDRLAAPDANKCKFAA